MVTGLAVLQVLIKPKPVFQAALVSEARQQASRSADSGQEGALKDEDRGSSPPEDLAHSGTLGRAPQGSPAHCESCQIGTISLSSSFLRVPACSAPDFHQGAGVD